MTWLTLLQWDDGERGFATVLQVLARELADAGAAQVEMHATASRSMAELRQEEHELAQEEAAAARRHVDDFRTAVLDARQRSGADGSGEARYDSTQPDEDAMADLLIQYLVRTGYADVRTEELAPQRHRYHLRVDWPRLRELAESAGHQIPV
jgi:hypothetical protein